MGRMCKLAVAGALAFAASAGAAVKLTPALRLGLEERYDHDHLLPVSPIGDGILMTKLTPEGGLSLESRTLNSTVHYAAALIVRHGGGSTTLDHRGELTLHHQPSRRSQIDLLVRLWRVSDPTSLPRIGLAWTPSPVFYGEGDLSGSLRLLPRWTGRVGYRFESTYFLVGEKHLGLMHAPFAEAWYAASRRAELGLGYRFQYFVFEGQPARAHTAFARYRYRLSRLATLNVRGGPVWFDQVDRGGVLPAISLDLEWAGERLNLAFAVGHDLAGASGLTAALWADHARVLASWRASAQVQLQGGAMAYRNGLAPAEGFNPLGGGASAFGYAVGAAVEWRPSRSLSGRLSVDRVSQIGSAGMGVPPLSHNIVSARVLVVIF